MNPRAVVCRISLVALATLVALGAEVTDVSAATRTNTVRLLGTFALNAGTCNATTGQVSGSYFRLIFPGGSLSRGPFFNNANSRCVVKSYTILRAGAQHGLVTGSYQPNPSPVFDQKGNALADGIVRPVSFTGINLSLSTNPVDPQTRHAVPRPQIALGRGDTLSGQLQAVSAAWDGLFINQGSPKPGGKRPGTTLAVSGVYNPRTRAFVLTWTSQIVKGRYNGFVGYWQLAGTFVPSGKPLPRAPTSGSAAQGDVRLLSCGGSPGRGWSAGGTVFNRSSHALTYRITVAFVSNGQTLAHATTSVPLAAGHSSLWSTSAQFRSPATTRCVVSGVSAT